MESDFGFRMSRSAYSDLDEIMNYISAELANPQAAVNFYEKLSATIDEARAFPESGLAVINEFLPDINIRKKLVGNFTMFYYPDYNERIVYITRIVYSRRNLDEIIRGMKID